MNKIKIVLLCILSLFGLNNLCFAEDNIPDLILQSTCTTSTNESIDIFTQYLSDKYYVRYSTDNINYIDCDSVAILLTLFSFITVS